MLKLVVDSSVIVKWLHQEEEQFLNQADQIIQDAQHGSVILLAPELAKYEVGNALLLSKKITADQAKISLGTLYSLPIQFIAQSENAANETYRMAQQANITYYDASFIALAKQENATLVTDNSKHQGKTQEIKVISLNDYV